METFLAPIERPAGLVMKLAYYFTRKQFGKVLTPFKVHSARMPVAEYRTSTLFSDAERAALDYVTELTRDKKVNPDTFARLARHHSEREICEIVWLVASEHLYNITNLGLNIHSDRLCDITRHKN